MSWLQPLILIENRLNELSKWQFFQLYCIVILLFLTFMYHFLNTQKLFAQPTLKQVQYQTHAIDSFKFMNALDVFLKKHDLILTQFQEQYPRSYTLKATGNLTALLLLINFIEHYSTINILKTIKLQHHTLTQTMTLFLEFTFDTVLYNTASFQTINQKILKLDEKAYMHQRGDVLKPDFEQASHKELHIHAIVNQRALINNKWYEPFEYIHDIKIHAIKPKYVVFENKQDHRFIIHLRP